LSEFPRDFNLVSNWAVILKEKRQDNNKAY